MHLWIIWLIAAVAFFIGEIMTEGFCLFWFSIASLLALFISLITDNIVIQAGFFFALAITLLVSTKKLTANFFKSRKNVESNVTALIGKTAKVVEKIDPIEGFGKVKIDGEVWKAISEDEALVYELNEPVIIKNIDGVKLIISKK